MDEFGVGLLLSYDREAALNVADDFECVAASEVGDVLLIAAGIVDLVVAAVAAVDESSTSRPLEGRAP